MIDKDLVSEYAAQWTLNAFKGSEDNPPHHASLCGANFIQIVYWEDFQRKREQLFPKVIRRVNSIRKK